MRAKENGTVMVLPFLLQQQSAEKRPLGQAEGQDFAQLLRIRLQALIFTISATQEGQSESVSHSVSEEVK